MNNLKVISVCFSALFVLSCAQPGGSGNHAISLGGTVPRVSSPVVRQELNNGRRLTRVLASRDGCPVQMSQRYSFGMTSFKGKYWIVGGIDREGHALNDVWSSEDGATWSLVHNDSDKGTAGFGRRYGLGLVSWGEKLWVIGGADGDGNTLNDVWSTEDGISWTQELEDSGVNPNEMSGPSPRFSARYFFGTAVFKNKLWIMGGDDGSGQNSGGRGKRLNDVWSTTNGKNWTRELANTAKPGKEQFAPRAAFGIAVSDNKLLVIGGWDGDDSPRYNDVWTSEDGKKWTQVLKNSGGSSTQFSRRHNFGTAVLGGKVYIIGGILNQNTLLNDVWSSDDNGATWSKVEREGTSDFFTGRYSFGTAVLDNKLIVVGGAGTRDGRNLYNDAWVTSDGRSWNQGLGNSNPPKIDVDNCVNQFSTRFGFGTAVKDGKIWVVGGNDGKGNKLNDVWSSEDGVYWKKELDNSEDAKGTGTQFSKRSYLGLTVKDDQLWVIGGAESREEVLVGDNLFGIYDFKKVNDVWSSYDGKTWTQVLPQSHDRLETSQQFSGRTAFGLVIKDNKFWVLGGMGDTGSEFRLNDVWSSSDGKIWNEELDFKIVENSVYSSTQYVGRAHFGIILKDGYIWVLGGSVHFYPVYSRLRQTNDIWKSSNGKEWTIVKPHDPSKSDFMSRSFINTVLLNNRIWLMGGRNRSNNIISEFNDIWSSDDGVNWVQELSSEDAIKDFFARDSYETVVKDGKIWIIGGRYQGDQALNDVWVIE